MKRIIIIILLAICFVFIWRFQKTHIVVKVSNSQYCNSPLPWPGIVSTNPLYPFKKIRDKIIRSYLIDNTEKLDYLLFDSDKYLREVMLLDDTGNYEDAYKTGLRGQHDITIFITEFVNTLIKYEKTPTWSRDRFSCVTKRQQRILQELLQKHPSGKVHQNYMTLMGMLKQNINGFPKFLEMYKDRFVNPDN
jgi:hypothetical protein